MFHDFCIDYRYASFNIHNGLVHKMDIHILIILASRVSTLKLFIFSGGSQELL